MAAGSRASTSEITYAVMAGPPCIASHQRNLRHVLVEGGARRDRGVPALDILEDRPLGHEVAIAPHHDADRDVAIGELVAREILGVAELLVEHRRGGACLLLAGRDRGGVAL